MGFGCDPGIWARRRRLVVMVHIEPARNSGKPAPGKSVPYNPGSHLKPSIVPQPEEEGEVVCAEIPAGSVLVLHASTWHGGGPNSTEQVERYGLSIQYVSGWCRQQQNLMLGTPRELVASYPRKLQELIGYSMYRNVMGHVDRQHPLSLLGSDVAPEMVWDKMKRSD